MRARTSARLSHFVHLPRGALQIKCTCCLIHRLNRQLLQSARAHAPAARARPHNLGCKHAGARDEYGDEDETSLQIFGLRGWRWSRGRGEGREGGAGGCQVRGKSQKIGPMFVCACKCCADVDSPDGARDACKCMSVLLFCFFTLSRVGVDLKLLSVGCETTLCASLVPSTPPSHVRVCECQTI